MSFEFKFAKYEGLGNDFVVVDRRGGGAQMPASQVRWLCDRHVGVGADGVLSLWSDDSALGRMQVQNADGSEAGMCGNGLRCIVAYLDDTGILPQTQSVWAIRVGAQLFHCKRLQNGQFEVNMGIPKWAHRELPKNANGDMIELHADGVDFLGTAVWLGNPHFVIFSDSDPHTQAKQHGSSLSHHEAFIDGANISFVQPHEDHMLTWVHERGVGLTHACGSGACAVAAAMWQRGMGQPTQKTTVQIMLPGGVLRIRLGLDGKLLMAGPARHIYDGQIHQLPT